MGDIRTRRLTWENALASNPTFAAQIAASLIGAEEQGS
jgi:hypothetical protein